MLNILYCNIDIFLNYWYKASPRFMSRKSALSPVLPGERVFLTMPLPILSWRRRRCSTQTQILSRSTANPCGQLQATANPLHLQGEGRKISTVDLYSLFTCVEFFNKVFRRSLRVGITPPSGWDAFGFCWHVNLPHQPRLLLLRWISNGWGRGGRCKGFLVLFCCFSLGVALTIRTLRRPGVLRERGNTRFSPAIELSERGKRASSHSRRFHQTSRPPLNFLSPCLSGQTCFRSSKSSSWVLVFFCF